MQSLMDAALTYLKSGLSVIPVKPDKKPYIRWEPYQKRKPTEEEVRAWWEKWPSAMIGLVTGGISAVVVIDIDEPQGEETLSEFIPDSLLMPTCRTPRGGKHLYFKAPEKPISNNARIIPGCDFRGQGGYVHCSSKFKWCRGLPVA